MASVAFHDAQKYSDVSYFRSGIRRYFTQKVFDRTGMSPVDFLNLPVNISRLLLEEIETVNKQDSAAAASAEEEMRRQLQEAQQGQGKGKR